jgi:glycosyltransferase involved in cell wall biosynthesis
VQHLHDLAGNDERIIFTDFQSGKLLQQLFSNAAIIVQPTEAEGLSIALLESMNYGRPLLVSDTEENKEALGEYGWYFQSGNTIDLRKKLASLLKKSPQEREARARRAQHYVRIAYNWETIADRTKVVYQQLLNEKIAVGEAILLTK